ncbi:translocation protein [Suhomyces tanzawaensis NRRL Y-17324]|uniref:Translocation protein n=1 Tax=Suhomyces tanzawaensis NRRL Y-17324 TaxID=984487 RepID=A0A1E4SKD5_9ASCO|nr:translocation protein [Suhomyces tanzawaensis NRRL Y-17324]ODV79964.1 translocation protein [Suhomyces tanzawaensis NRRL Y-17324]
MGSEYTYDEEGETWPFFLLAVLSFILVPVTVKYLYNLRSTSDAKSENASIKGAISQEVAVENAAQINSFQAQKKSSKIFNWSLLFIVVGWSAFVYVALNLVKEADLQGAFDPYTILDVSQFASERDIKSKYRKLSLKFHPDKLPKDLTDAAKQEMEAAFIRINLAYKSLTDEVTRNNFLKYGHPDGPQDVSHGIALPKFLVEGKYSSLMIVVYFLLIGVLLPTIVGTWWGNVKSYTKRGLHIETAGLFTRRLTNRDPTKIYTVYDLLDLICLSNEVRTTFKHLDYNQVRDLIARHLNRNFEYVKTNPSLEAEKVKIVAMLPKLIEGLIEIAVVFRQADIVVTACDLQKSIIQAVKPEGKYQELLQLPYVDRKAVEKSGVKKLGKLFAVSKEEAGKILGIEDKTKLEAALSVAASIGSLRVLESEFKVPGEDVVTPASNAHISLKFLVKSPKLKSCPEIDESRLKDEETLDYMRNPASINEKQPVLPYSYSPFFPSNVRNSWTAFLLSQKDAKLVEGTTSYKLENVDLSNLALDQETWKKGEDVTIGTFKINLAVPTPQNIGIYHFRLILKNNAYFGCDVDIPVELEVKTPPSLMSLKKKEVDSDDDESDISDPEEDTLAGALAALRGQSTQPSKIEEQDDDVSDNESVFTDINTDTEDEGEN